jgi:hypothetical protein
MRNIVKQPYIKDGIEIFPGETVFFVSTSGHSIRTRFAIYLGYDSNADNVPVIQYPSRRLVWRSKHDYNWEPFDIITSLPRKRIISMKHFEKAAVDLTPK